MNRSLATHGLWIAITVGTFVAGAYWARTPEGSPGTGPAGSPATTTAIPSPSANGALRPSGRAGKASRPAAGSAVAALVGTSRAAVERRIFSTAPLLDKAEIEALVRDAIKDPDPITRRHAFDRILASISPENALVLRAAMAETGANGDQWRLFDYAWGAKDPAGALAHIQVIEEKHRDGFISNMLPGLASVDPRTAIGLIEGMEAGDRRERMTGRLIEGLRDHDLGMTTDYVLKLADAGNPNATRHLENLTRDVLHTEGLESGRAWAEALPAGPLQAASLDRVANQFVDRDPQAAAAWATRYAGEEYAARVIEEVGDEWAERDAPAAVAWLDSLPAGRGQNEGMSSALHEWARRDPVAAGGYLQTMAPSDARDAAIGSFSGTIAREDPQTAISWAETITAEGPRIQTITRVGQSWARRDPAAATAWATTSGLPETVQNAIINPPRDRR